MDAVARGELLRLAAVRRHEVDVAERLDIPELAARGRERDLRAVGRPGGIPVVVVAVGELRRLGRPVGRDDEDVRVAIAGPADAVELEAEPLEAARRPFAVVLLRLPLRLVLSSGS